MLATEPSLTSPNLAPQRIYNRSLLDPLPDSTWNKLQVFRGRDPLVTIVNEQEENKYNIKHAMLFAEPETMMKNLAGYLRSPSTEKTSESNKQEV